MSAPKDNTQPDEMRSADEPNSTNPYTPPLAPLEVLPRETLEAQFPYASTGKRFLNWLIDHFAIYGLAIAVGVVIGISEKFGVFTGWLDRLAGMSRIENLLYGSMLSLLYYTSLESIYGRTLGKLITGTKGLSVQGTKPQVLQILGRTLARFIPFEPLSFFGETGWHDRWSGTRVVDLRDKEGRDAMARLSPQLARLYRK